jgi:AAA domain
VRDWVNEGEVLVRFGNSPKRAILFRTDMPFPKLVQWLKDPSGRSHKLEFLCAGQQVVVHGVHPDTRRDHRWANDRSPVTVPRAELPTITGSEAQALLDYIVEALREQHGYQEAAAPSSYNGSGTHTDTATAAPRADLAGMRYGVNIHDTQLRHVASQLAAGVPIDDVTPEVLDATRVAVAALPECADWDWDKEERPILKMAFDFVCKHAVERPELVDLLPLPLHERWRAREAAGETRLRIWSSGVSGGYWCIRGAKQKAAGEGHDEEEAAEREGGEAPEAAPAPVDRRPTRKKPQKIEAIPFKAVIERDLPGREFLYAQHYQRGQCTCSVGQDGAGKSTVSIAEAAVMCTARNLLGEQPTQRYRVWLHNADDDSVEMMRRIVAFCRLHNVRQTELEGWLFVTGKDNFKIKVVKGTNGASIPDTATVDAIVKTIRDNEIDVAIFDPLIHLHTVPENNNTQVAEVAEQFADIASICDCSTDIVHHVRKIQNGVSDKEFTSEDSRGGGALRAAVRALRVYNRMTTAEAEEAGIPKDLRGFYLRVDRGKANYLPPAVKSTWFHLASVTLDNGDDVGTIEPWTHPGQTGAPNAAKEAAQNRVDMLFLKLLAAATLRGDYVSDAYQSAQYAPKVLPRARKRSPTDCPSPLSVPQWTGSNLPGASGPLTAALAADASSKSRNLSETARTTRERPQWCHTERTPYYVLSVAERQEAQPVSEDAMSAGNRLQQRAARRRLSLSTASRFPEGKSEPTLASAQEPPMAKQKPTAEPAVVMPASAPVRPPRFRMFSFREICRMSEEEWRAACSYPPYAR